MRQPSARFRFGRARTPNELFIWIIIHFLYNIIFRKYQSNIALASYTVKV